MQYKITVLNEILAEVAEQQHKIIFSYPKSKIWNQTGVSLQRRIDESADFKRRVDMVITADNLERYIVSADSAAPTRCIDGRIMVGWQTDKTIQNRALGPKIAGGTVHAALAHRIVDIESITNNLKFEEDIRYVVGRFQEIGLGSGGHIDDHQTGWNTGCGAVDNINLILDRLQRPEHQQQLRELANSIIGDTYDARGIANEVIGRMLYLDALKPKYMPKENDDPNGEFLYKKTVMQTMRQASHSVQESVPALAGTHNEVAVVLNYVPHTTFDSDHFSADNNDELQAFGWDVWQVYDEAERLYTYDMHQPVADQLNAVQKRIKYVTTRVLLGISTVMVLTDGSLRVVSVNA